MVLAETEYEWAARAARHLKAELKRADLTYEELAKRLKKHSRATMSAHFFLASLRAIGVEAVRLEDLEG
jgi:Domain of unknown function (DUF6471)